jgi:hypothetical protein
MISLHLHPVARDIDGIPFTILSDGAGFELLEITEEIGWRYWLDPIYCL